MKKFLLLIVLFVLIFFPPKKVSAQKTLPISAVQYNPTFKQNNTTIKNGGIKPNNVVSSSNLYDGNDVQVFPSNNSQSEVHLSINSANPRSIILSCNTVPIGNSFQGYYYSSDGGLTWTGQDFLPNSASGRGDPSTAFDASGNGYIESMSAPNTSAEPDGYYIFKTTNGGASWLPQVRGVGPLADGDKPMIAADNTPSTAFTNNLYCAWGHTHISFNRSTDGGKTFSAPLVLPPNNSQGANLQTGPHGEVYLCFADYGNTSSGSAVDIEFFNSSNGGQTLTGAGIINFTGIRSNPDPNPLFNGIRVNDFPSMGVDKSYGSYRGRRYVVMAGKENGNGKGVIYFTYTDDNIHFSPIKEISIPNATQCWFPWISVDDTNGDIYVDYYAFDTSTQWETNTYVAFSKDGGTTFSNQKVSDVSHITAPIPGFDQGYSGDYIGIAAHGGKALSAWTDNRNGTWQIYVSEVGNKPVITGAPAFCSSATYTVSNVPTGSTVTWSAYPSGIVSLTPSGNQVNVSKITQGSVTLTANISGSYSNLSPSLGISSQSTVTSISATMSGSCSNGFQDWYLQATPSSSSARNWQWTVDNPSTGTYNFQSPNSPSTLVHVSGGGGVSVSYVDECGLTSYRNGVTIYSPCGRSGAIAAYPNPTNTQITVQYKNTNNTNQTATATTAADNTATVSSFTVELYNEKGKVLKSGQGGNSNASVVLNTSDLANGIYYLHVKQGSDLIEKQIVVQH